MNIGKARNMMCQQPYRLANPLQFSCTFEMALVPDIICVEKCEPITCSLCDGNVTSYSRVPRRSAKSPHVQTTRGNDVNGHIVDYDNFERAQGW